MIICVYMQLVLVDTTAPWILNRFSKLFSEGFLLLVMHRVKFCAHESKKLNPKYMEVKNIYFRVAKFTRPKFI
jgi:hypothetical protein